MKPEQARKLLDTFVFLVEKAFMEKVEVEIPDSGRWKCPECGVWTLHKQEHQCWMAEEG